MKPYFFICLLLSLAVNAQKPEYALALIPAELKENANAVVRLNKVEIDIASRNAMTIKTCRVVTVLNELGQNSINASESDNVKSIGATVYNAFGQEIKKLKRKDFREISVSEGSIISDNKVTYLDYTPTEYPFTIVYESETSDQNTAFIPRWFPIERLFESVEKSTISVSCISGLGLKFKDYNVGNRNIKKEEAPNNVSFTAESLTALKREQYSPAFTKLAPNVIFGLEKFNLEGVNGEAVSWENFSSWNYNNLLVGTDELLPETQTRIKALVGSETDPIKKAKIVYKYVQDKTRYVSIQLGIGGWRPMKAKDVDRLGYGDCKALTNYTRALLNTVGVPSYYTIVYGDDEKLDLQQDFVSMQGNHVILAIPDGNDLKWMECTSQTIPFNYQGNFTDDRLALIVKPDGGHLVRTNSYKAPDNSQFTKAKYDIAADGGISGDVEITSKGIQYRSRMALEGKSTEDLHDFYKDYFGQINNLKLNKIDVVNDKDKTEFKEKVSVTATDYANIANGKIMFAINAFNQYSEVPQRYRTRNNPFEIDRGFYDEDEITITLPDGFSIEVKPENFELSDVFGKYKTEYTMIDAKHMLYKRSLLINEGSFPAGEYEKFRKFMEQIAKNDNAKCVLMKS
jgi:transglutaminase-like putative cysteine protease